MRSTLATTTLPGTTSFFPLALARIFSIMFIAVRLASTCRRREARNCRDGQREDLAGAHLVRRPARSDQPRAARQRGAKARLQSVRYGTAGGNV